MLRTISIAFVSGLLAASAGSPAYAGVSAAPRCPGSIHTVGNVTMNSDGVVSRMVYVATKTESQRGNAEVQYVPVVRDRIELASGDKITLNAALEMQDAMLQVEVRARSQERDEKGIFSTTYAVKEIMTPMFGGKGQKPVTRASFVTVKSNYMGKGTYSKGCGEVQKIDLDFATDFDAMEN
jgi:hypothetical protein